MNMNSKGGWFYPLAVIAIAIGTLVSCDNSTKPGEEPEEHLFYIAPETGNTVKVFSVEQEAIVDSFTVDSLSEEGAMRIHVIGDDSLLAASSGPRTYLIDLETKEIVGSFAARDPVFSPDSRYYFCSYTGEVRMFPEQFLRHDGLSRIALVSFGYQSEVMSFMTLSDSSGPLLGVYDIPDNSLIIKPWYSGGAQVYSMSSYPADGLNKVFTSCIGMGFSLAAGNLDCDTIRQVKIFDQISGIVIPVVTPDEKYVFFSDIVSQGFEFVPTERIFVYDAETEDSVAAIAYEGIDQVGYMAVTYDSKYLMAGPFNEGGGVTVVCLIDAVNFEVIGAYDCGFEPRVVTSKYGAENGNLF